MHSAQHSSVGSPTLPGMQQAFSARWRNVQTEAGTTSEEHWARTKEEIQGFSIGHFQGSLYQNVPTKASIVLKYVNAEFYK